MLGTVGTSLVIASMTGLPAGVGECRDHGVTGNEAAQLAGPVHDGEFVLGGPQQQPGGITDRRLRSERFKMRNHGFRDAEVSRHILEAYHLRFRRRREIDEDRDEDEQRVAADQSDESEHEGERLADPRGDVRRCVRGYQSASTARRTRPPSIGKAGMRLNSTRKMFTEASRTMKPSAGLSSRCSASKSKCVFIRRISAAAMTMFTAGPASATTISWPGFSGIRSSRASPPIGSSVMSGVRIPKRRAARAWPNSCATTQAKNARMKPMPSIAA